MIFNGQFPLSLTTYNQPGPPLGREASIRRLASSHYLGPALEGGELFRGSVRKSCYGAKPRVRVDTALPSSSGCLRVDPGVAIAVSWQTSIMPQRAGTPRLLCGGDAIAGG